ncbi:MULTISPECIES: zinc ABC transporter substrate-binding protein [Thalassospira]|jgi:manganese/zinc/iron transport system substrate-binding protein|uniref:metal ABC transporter solute-binding protein, Zn/Mn family n=1 Tax=Thalassospira TaxID=168934 RepID=UPI00081006DE|nr:MULTISPECIES: zinc ABC transporter substrate-binding protein [Thalassospira]MAB31541.1 manganese transporter [Thalassospira sp.]MBA05526.1 manganese transporter [Thalassospira sp.]MDM7974588.1 zinc ABC transporter substrate-binding protein [Thalassospira xiamenensis]OCK06175.1 ABC-type metal ion transporter, periplasmic subunit [Thalassospira sp. KO164]OHZ02144.1 manganese transporter [Thalassospira sp. MIT1004]|tara:strand:+ start:1096 stop:2070 length:975 start_codon:yes stop_codon:yes gene_type:complete
MSLRRIARNLGFALAAVCGFVAVSVTAASAKPIDVVATTSMIADAARQVAGDRAKVTALMGPGVDPHSYRQTRSDIAAMARADLVLWHGLYLEAQLEEFFLDLEKRRNVIAVGEAIDTSKLLSHAQYKGRYDPHVWMDPQLWETVVLAVRDALIKTDPEGEATYRANADKHIADIEKLITYMQLVTKTVPEKSRVLLTAHDAFSYFGRGYDFEVLGIQGISTESEAGLRRVEELVDTIVDRKIAAVFVESSVPERNVRALIEGAAARGQKVEIGGTLFSDAMGEPGTYEGTYIGMIDHNATLITRALGGDAPATGMQGKLAAGS